MMTSSSEAHVPPVLGSTLPWGPPGLLPAPLGLLHETLLLQKTEPATTVQPHLPSGYPISYATAKHHFHPVMSLFLPPPSSAVSTTDVLQVGYLKPPT